jgi:hypothetical protein
MLGEFELTHKFVREERTVVIMSKILEATVQNLVTRICEILR